MVPTPKSDLPSNILPGGTVTFLFTDLEGSTELLERLGSGYATLLADQRRILRDVFSNWHGKEVDTQGDSFFYSFPRATEAVLAAVEAQRILVGHPWPESTEVRVRMGLHTGEPWMVEEGYVGIDVHRASRVGDSGHGGQVLLSETTAVLVRDELPEGVSLKDLGRHRLKDMRRPESICQLVIEGLPSEFPPLRSLEMLPSVSAILVEELERIPRDAGECPYRGLAAFREQDAPFFFGRECFTATLLEAIKVKPKVVVIVGSSGSGKSSAVYAGLIPQMRKESGWLIADFRPGSRPFYALAGTMLSRLEMELSETDRLIEIRKLAIAMRENELSLAHVVERVLEKSADCSRMVLLVDQFEELYTLCPEPEVRIRFLEELLSLVGVEAGGVPEVVLLMTLRADFMGQALTHRPFADTLQTSSLILGPMRHEELRTTVEKPAELQGAALEPRLVERILDDVGEEPGNLPLLEFALTLLWDRLDEGWMTHAAYEEIDGVEGALAQYAEEVFEGMDEGEKSQARTIFTQLIQPGEGTEDTRRVTTHEELGDQKWELVQQLADERLVVTGRDDAGNDIVEVVHEALIRGWERLRDWMGSDRSFRVWQEELRTHLRQWEYSDRDEGALLRGVLLSTAEGWLHERPDELGDLEKTFIQESIKLREQRLAERERRRRRITLGLAGGLVVALALAITAGLFGQQASRSAQLAEENLQAAQIANTQVAAEAISRATAEAVAIEQRQVAEDERKIAVEERKLATSYELSASVRNNLESDPELSVMLGIEAVLTAETSEAVLALHQAISQLRLVKRVRVDENIEILDISYTPDNKLWVTSDEGGIIRLWDPQTGNEIHSWEGHAGGINKVEFSVDGNKLFTVGQDRIAKVWDVHIPQNTKGEDAENELILGERLSLVHENDVNAIDYNPHHNLIGTTDGIVRLWDLTSGQELQTLSAEGEEIVSLDFSPNGKFLATGSDNGTVRIWDIDTGMELASMLAHYSWVNAIEFNPGSDMVVSGDQNGALNLWNIFMISSDGNDGLKTNEINYTSVTILGHTDQIFDLSFSPDGYLLVTASRDGSVKVWESSTGSELYTFHGGFVGFDINPRCGESTERSFEWCRNHLLTAENFEFWTGAGDRIYIKVWDISPTGNPELVILPGMFGFFNSEGTQLITLDKFREVSPIVHVWNIPTIPKKGETIDPVIELDSYQFPPFDGLINGAVSEDRTKWGLIYSDNTVRIFDVLDGDLIQILSGIDHVEQIDWISFHPDGNTLATCSSDGTVILWDIPTGEELHSFEHNSGELGFCEFNKGGSQLLTNVLSGTTKLWDMEKIGTYEWVPRIDELDLSDFPLNNMFIPGVDVEIWTTLSGEEYARVIAQTGRLGESYWVWYSPDKKLFAYKDLDGGFNVMDITLEQDILKVTGQELNMVRFSPDGSLVMVSDLEENVVRVYVLHADDLVAIAKSRVTRSFTSAECWTYMHTTRDCPRSE